MAVNMEHDEAQRLLATFAARGLEGPELAALRAHVATCDICGDELRELTQLDQEMDMMFAGARPAANLEDRIVRGLWMGGSARSTLKMPRLRVHPAVWKVSMGVAATIVLGTIGYIGNDLITTNRLPLMGVAVQAPGTDDDAGDGKSRSGAAASAVPENFSTYGFSRDDFDSDSEAGEAGKDPKGAQGAIRSPQQQGQARVDAVTKRFYEHELRFKESARGRNEAKVAGKGGSGHGVTWEFG